jgi:hypothetical protein
MRFAPAFAAPARQAAKRLQAFRLLALLDKLPKLTRLTELRILRNRQFAPKKKIAESVLV